MLIFAYAAAIFAATRPAIDSVTIPSLATAPIIDGRVSDREYGAPTRRITTAAGDVTVWMTRSNGFVHIAALLPDTSFYWGDDFVVSLDADGSGGESPGPGDRQWYFRRTLDSSVVLTAQNGRWEAPGQAPPMLGAARRGPDWEVASSSSATEWIVELRVRESSIKTGSNAPRIALRTYNSDPRGWWSWPAPPPGTPAQRVERTPDLWANIFWR